LRGQKDLAKKTREGITKKESGRGVQKACKSRQWSNINSSILVALRHLEKSRNQLGNFNGTAPREGRESAGGKDNTRQRGTAKKKVLVGGRKGKKRLARVKRNLKNLFRKRKNSGVRFKEDALSAPPMTHFPSVQEALSSGGNGHGPLWRETCGKSTTFKDPRVQGENVRTKDLARKET